MAKVGKSGRSNGLKTPRSFYDVARGLNSSHYQGTILNIVFKFKKNKIGIFYSEMISIRCLYRFTVAKQGFCKKFGAWTFLKRF